MVKVFGKYFRFLNALFLSGAAACLYATQAHAGMNCTGPNPASITFTVPTGTYTIPRDTPAGTRITPWTALQGRSTSVWTNCSGAPNIFYGPVSKGVLPSSGSAVVDGMTYPVYPTSVTGVGLIAGVENYLPGGWFGDTRPLAISWATAGTWAKSASFSDAPFGVSMRFAFVKTGVITGGTASYNGELAAQSGMDSRPIGTPDHIQNILLTGSATFVPLACDVPPVSVSLGDHLKSKFSGVGYGTELKDVNIQLNNCPAGMNSIQYMIEPVTALANSSLSVVALDQATSTATGVGIQLLNSAGSAPFQLSNWNTLTTYSSSVGGSYVINLKARYYQISPTVTPGEADASMTITMLYL